MHKLQKINIPFLLIIVLFFGCKKEAIMLNPDLGHNYFPVLSGTSITYKVDSITYNDFYTPVKVDTFSFYLRFDIDSSFTDSEGRITNYYRKFYKTDTSSWQLVHNYSITKTNFRVETYEENVRFIKLAFPVKNTTIWNMNALNFMNPTESYYSDFDIPKTYNNQLFDSTITIIHQDLETLISKEEYIEDYAKNIGLIYRHVVSISKDVSGKWKSGYIYSYTIQSYTGF